MGFFDDFARTPLGQRLLQHVGSEVAPFAALPQQSNPILRSLQGVAAGVTAAPKLALDTVGLGLEGSANVAKGGIGAGLLLADQAGVPLPGISTHDKALLDALAQTYKTNQSGGGDFMQAYQDAINTVDQLRAHGGTPLAWGVGGASLALDPSNFLPVGRVEDVLKGIIKPAGQAALGAVRDEAPGVLAKVGQKIAPDVAAKIEAAAPRLAPDVAAVAPEVAPTPASGPPKTIFGEDASVVHSGTYPGPPQAAGRLVPEVAPQSAQEAAALAPDATINDKMNALEQNPNLPVQSGTPQSVLDFKAAFDSAYGDNTFARKNGIAKLQRELGVTFDGQTATFAKNGVDVTSPVLDFLNGRAAMKNDRKAIAAALDFTKGEVDNLAGATGGPVNPLLNQNPGIAAGLQVPASVYLRGGGALAGGTLGALQSNNDPTAILTGALAGGVGGAGLERVAANQTLRDLGQIGHTAGKAGMADALQNGSFSLKGVAHDWSADKTKTVRGLFLDTMTNYIRALVNKIPLSDIRAAREDLIKQAKTTGSTYNAGHPYTSMTADLFDQLGQDISKYDLHQAYGQGYLGSADQATTRAGKQLPPLHPLASAGTGAAFSLGNFSTYATGGLGIAAGAARGAARPYTNAAFNAINDLEHNAARDAGFRVAVKDQLAQVAPAFLEQIKAAGGDISRLSADGLFPPAEANAALPGAGAVWQGVLDQILGTPAQEAVKANAKKGVAAVAAVKQQDGLAAQYVKQAFGDYSTRGGFQKALGAVAPFSRYTLGQIPVAATMVATHPGATLLVAKMLRDANNRAQQTGTPSYNAANLDTPPLNGLAGLEAGAPASGSINLLNAISPVNLDVGSLGDITDASKTPYQKVVALMNAVGLQPNPLIQAGAYALGLNDQGPGAQSRFAGLENALGGPQVPTLKGQLDNVRQAVSGQLPDNYDPVYTYIAEQTLAQTQKPISDPGNKEIAIQANDPTSPLYQQAKAAVDKGAAIKNLISGVSPVSLTSTTDVKAQYRAAKANDQRYTKEQIAQAAQISPEIAAQMQAVNAGIVAQQPALATYTTPKLSAADKADPRVKAFAAKNAAIKNVAPNIYAQMLKEYKQQLGIK